MSERWETEDDILARIHPLATPEEVDRWAAEIEAGMEARRNALCGFDPDGLPLAAWR